MASASQRPQEIWSRLGRAGHLFLLALLLRGIFYFLTPPQWVNGLSWIFLFLTSVVVVYRLLRFGTRMLLWRLRHRLLVAYLFIALVPVLLIGALAVIGTFMLAGQTAVWLVTSELDRRVTAVRMACEGLAAVSPNLRAEAADRLARYFAERNPGFQLRLDSGGQHLVSAGGASLSHPAGWPEASGLVWRNGAFHGWAHVRRNGTEITALFPLDKDALGELVPKLGDVFLIGATENEAATGKKAAFEVKSDGNELRIEGLPSESQRVPPPENRLDLEAVGFSVESIQLWDQPEKTQRVLVYVRSRTSAVLRVLFSQRADWDNNVLLNAFVGLAIAFLVVEAIALLIGISLSRTITAAVHNLYEGTERVMEGDFSHRINVKGKDQLASLGHSFNRMTENLERLLKVAKEKERLQAELEIAREVQNQLYPRSVPQSPSLSLHALCHPARTVSGDYYDYHSIQEGRIAITLGDVSGKGISAALLMATVQSSFRTQIRHCLEMAAIAGVNGGAMSQVSTAKLMAQLNLQLYANTSPEKFATMFFGVYDEANGQLHYTNAGHLPPILIRNGETLRLAIDGMVVGAFPFAQYGESTMKLERGDLLVCFTDGISEPENEYGEMFGEDRLIDLVRRNSARSDEEIAQAVFEAVERWTGSPELQDDMTLLIARKH